MARTPLRFVQVLPLIALAATLALAGAAFGQGLEPQSQPEPPTESFDYPTASPTPDPATAQLDVYPCCPPDLAGEPGDVASFANAAPWKEPWPAEWPRRSVAVAPADRPEPRGALDGVVVYASGGHGWAYQSGAWRLGRPIIAVGDGGIVEDLGNVDQLTFFADHCLRAGATVVPMRPVGFQEREAVVDNADSGVSFEGDWREGAGRWWFGDPKASSRYRYARGVEGEPTARARFSARLAEGFYPVYVWTPDGDDRSNQEYVVRHSGGATARRVNHRLVGKGWIYLGTFHFAAEAPAVVEVHNSLLPGDSGEVVVADAVRFGNGRGDVVRLGGTVSGEARSDEASRYWVQRMIGHGGSPRIYDPDWPELFDDDADDNVGSPPRMAAYMNRETQGSFRDRIFVGFHSNAGGPAARGAVGLYCCEPGHALNPPNGKGTANQLELAETLGAETNAAMRALLSANPDAFEAAWSDRTANVFGSGGVNYTAYGEISLANTNGEFDATINEVGFHSNEEDAKLLSDPRVRDALARSTVRGVIRFLAARGGLPAAFAPDPPKGLRAVSDASGQPTLLWTPPKPSPLGGEPTGYVVYASSDGLGFGEIARLRGGELDGFPLAARVPAGETIWFRVSAMNGGGESAPSATVGVRRGEARARALLVDAFDRWERVSLPRQEMSAASIYRHDPRRSNPGDILVRIGDGVAAWGGAFDSCQNECVEDGSVDLARYEAVVWCLGEESTRDETFSAGEQERLVAWVVEGGRLLTSGSEVGWDLDRYGRGPTPGDHAFARDILRISYTGDNAETSRVEAAPDGPFHGLFAFTFGADPSRYLVEHPDRFMPEEGAVVALQYVGGREGAAAVAWDGTATGQGKSITIGFPLDSIDDPWIRRDLTRRALVWLIGEP